MFLCHRGIEMTPEQFTKWLEKITLQVYIEDLLDDLDSIEAALLLLLS